MQKGEIVDFEIKIKLNPPDLWLDLWTWPQPKIWLFIRFSDKIWPWPLTFYLDLWPLTLTLTLALDLTSKLSLVVDFHTKLKRLWHLFFVARTAKPLFWGKRRCKLEKVSIFRKNAKRQNCRVWFCWRLWWYFQYLVDLFWQNANYFWLLTLVLIKSRCKIAKVWIFRQNSKRQNCRDWNLITKCKDG